MSNINFGRSNNRVIVTDDCRTYKKQNAGEIIGSGIVASTIGSIAFKEIKQPFDKAFLEETAKPNPLNDTFKSAIKPAIEKSGLKKKGVVFFDASTATAEEICTAIYGINPNSAQLTNKAKRKIKKAIELIEATKNGKNAFYTVKRNSITINPHKFAIATFHEMGHAINQHSGILPKTLNKIKPKGAMLSGLILLNAAFKRTKADGEKPKNIVDKVTTYAKNHAGLLAFAGMLPTVVDEGLASLRASNLTKGILSNLEHKELNKFHKKALLTYVGTAVATGICGYVTSKISDALSKPKEIHRLETANPSKHKTSNNDKEVGQYSKDKNTIIEFDEPTAFDGANMDN